MHRKMRISHVLLKRISSAFVFIGVSFAALLIGNPWVQGFLGLVVLALSYEWMCLGGMQKDKLSFLFYAITIGSVLSTVFISIKIICAVCLIGNVGCYYLISRSKKQDSQKKAFWFLWGVLYISIPVLIFLWIYEKGTLGLFFLFWLLGVIWTNDTAAYFIGSWLKGPKLASRISPKKTWSGFMGGCLLSAITGGIIASAFSLGSFLFFMGLGCVIAFLGSVGDLLESALKRYANVKDSSNLIPGHGGFLDRLDSILFVLPFYGLYFWWLGA